MPAASATARALPNLTLMLQGMEFPMSSLLSVNVTEHLQGPSTCTLRLAATGPQALRLEKAVEDTVAALGRDITLKVGDAVFFLGDIASLSYETSRGSLPSMSLTGFDRRYRMSRGTTTCAPFIDRTLREIAGDVVRKGSYGLTPAEPKGPKGPGAAAEIKIPCFIKSGATSDLAFLQALAGPIGFEVLVLGDQFFFRPSQHHTKSVLTLDADLDLRSFSADIPGSVQPYSVEVDWADPRTKTRGKEVVSIGEIKPMASQAVEPKTGAEYLAPLGRKCVRIHDAHVDSAEHAKEIALARLTSLALGLFEVRGTCDGRLDLHVGTVVSIKNIAKRFCGDYYLTSATHDFSRQGHVTSFSAERNAL